MKHLIDTSEEIDYKMPKILLDPSEILPTASKDLILNFHDYYRMSEKQLRELTKDSKNEKIKSINSFKYSLSSKQRMCLAIYLASGGKQDDYTYLLPNI